MAAKRFTVTDHHKFVRKLTRCGVLAAVLVSGASPPPSSIGPEDILGHLERTVTWYRHVTTGEPSSAIAGDILLRESTHQSALEAVRLAFEFARAEAALLAPSPQQGNSTPAGNNNLQQASQNAADRVKGIQTRIAEADASIAKAAGKQRESLIAKRSELSTELDLAKEIQDTVGTMIRFSGSVGGTGLIGKINELERSVPEAEQGRQKAAVPAPSPKAVAPEPQVFQAQTAGIVGLATELFTIHSNLSQIDTLIRSTDALLQDNERLKGPLVTEARSAIQRSDQITNSDTTDPQQLTTAQQELNGLNARFKKLSTAIVPLGDEGIALDAVRGNLSEELSAINAEYGESGRYLAIRAGTLGIVIAIVLFISALWRRAVFRYVHDSRRRRQFTVLRRLVVGFVVTIALVLAFVSEFGSLATYAGLLTAGLAVALQNVILSVVAYFFLIGRYGVRVGDRVTISGVTGDVIEIGLVRLSMMELGSDLHSTGRMVVYSNSVIFQPSALFKQMPGIHYLWHTVTVTLDPASDYQIAEQKLNEAVESVYAQYRDSIEKQMASFEASVDVDIRTPKPESALRFTDSGLVFTVRYPAEMKHASATDDQIMKALWDAIEKEPKLKFATSGTPKLQPVS